MLLKDVPHIIRDIATFVQKWALLDFEQLLSRLNSKFCAAIDLEKTETEIVYKS